VSVHGLKGKVNLVCFWSPRQSQSSRELLVVNALYGQFAKQGIDALAVSLSGERAVLLDALDEFHLGFPNLPNGFNIPQGTTSTTILSHGPTFSTRTSKSLPQDYTARR
jgi:hypothetical protein